jgi:hypothetical protein
MEVTTMNKRTTIGLVFAVAVISAISGGCGAAAAKSCRLSALAGPELQLDRRMNDYLISDHIYFSKEGSSGGRSFGGGGCGCN